MGMSLSEGGHLTHGHSVNMSGIFFKSVQYGLNKETEQLDYEAIAALAHQHKPALIVAGASAYSRIIDFERFAAIAHDVGALFMADIAHIAGLVAAGLHPSPVPVADFVTSTTHKTLRGPRSGIIMAKQRHASLLDRAIMPGIQGGPLMHVIAAKAVAFGLAKQPSFIDYQKQVLMNAKTLAATLHDLGYRIVTGGTDNHLLVVDLRSQTITGNIAQNLLERVGITVSKSTIPFDTQPPRITSGIRLGTPALTTRGMKESDMITVAHFINETFINRDNPIRLSALKNKIEELCRQFPLIRQQLG